MKLNEIEDRWGWGKVEGKYSVAILSKLGKSYELRGATYKDAKETLNRVVGDYQSDVFPSDGSANVRWHTDGEIAKMTIPSTGAELEFYMEKDGRV